jgi:hyperosmotically inducible periplasmic protein
MKRVICSVALGSILALGAPALAVAQAQSQAGTQASARPQGGRYDAEIQRKVQDKLKDDKFKNVKVDVLDQIVNLTGSVDLYAYKADADEKAHKVDKVKGVQNDIQVQGKQVSDAELREKLAEKLRYDRVGYGNVFNAILMNVQNGVVTLSGEVRTPIDKSSALAEVANTPGVRDVDDNIKVSPASPMDDEIRLRVARAVYSGPLARYAIDPQAPIRIVVNGGRVGLYGVVDNEGDKTFALMQARNVPGTLGDIEDHLVVANKSKQEAKK